MSAAMQNRIVDAGIGLAYSTKGAGIAGVWAEFLRQHVRFVEGPDAPHATWAVDGSAVWVNSDWTAQLSNPQVQFLIAHESLHIALDHLEMTRTVGATTPELQKILNLAQDAVINQALLDDGIGEMPTGENAGVTFNQYVRQGYTGPRDSVALYEWLRKSPPKKAKGGQGGKAGEGQGPKALQGCSPSGFPGDTPGPSEGAPGEGKAQGDKPQGGAANGQGQDDSGAGVAKQKVRAERARATLREAAMKAGEGTAVADLLAVRPTRASVRQIIRQGFERASVTALNRVIPSYSRAGRRSVDVSIMTPGKLGTEARVAFIGDVSGSMTPEGRAILVGFIERTAREFPSVRVFLVTHTSKVVWSGWLKPGGDLSKAKEAASFDGGTDFKPAYDAVKEAGPRFDVCVHFTDGFNAREWPESPARQLIVGLWGSGAGATPMPAGTKLVPVASVEGDA